MKVELFASEKEFPELVNPVQLAVDTRGRLWVAAWKNYPHWQPKTPMDDKLLILEDTDGDGKADKRTVFAGDLDNPTGFEFWNGGVIVAQAPNLVFLKDTNGDDHYDTKADPPRRHGLGRHAPHDEQLHVRSGWRAVHPRRNLPSQPGRDAVGADGAPGRRRRVPLRAAHVQVRDLHPDELPQPARARRSTTGDATSSSTRPAASRTTGRRSRRRSTTRRWSRPRRRARARCARGRSAAARSSPAVISPTRCRATSSSLNTIGFRGLLNYKITEDGAGLKMTEVDPIIESADENFRPVDAEIGADGALYVADWQNPIIGHMQHNLRDTSRDHGHGRIYRVTYDGPADAQAGGDRRRADRSAARSPEGAGKPRPLPRQDRIERPQQQRGAGGADRLDRRASTRAARSTST